ncbi:MAG: outer membrane protein assembly factor BamD [Beijerinckiaceae bacterium]|nr:outer membrane protein assembly factor BamD [Beijerinckiaceae bacterium]MCZ8301181.1 outer membrane protein assembly factor BamD [Beijerinckiaceae bacterium]
MASSQANSGRLAGRLTRLLAGALIALSVGACETISSLNPFEDKGPKSDIGKDEPADVLFNDGLARLEARDYGGASKKFVELDKQYPYSQWSRRALLLSTFASFEGGDYADAINHGRRYVQLYPASPDTPYAQFLVGMSYFNQITDISRDQDRAEKTIQTMDDLVRKWPNSEYAREAKDKMRVAQDQLAGKEMDVGRYYMQRRNWTGAINRYREVIVKYQTTRHVEEALSRLVEAYMGLGIVNEAQTAAAVLGHNFPDSQWYKDAFALLESGGLKPREDTGSWISRTFRGFTRTVGL